MRTLLCAALLALATSAHAAIIFHPSSTWALTSGGFTDVYTDPIVSGDPMAYSLTNGDGSVATTLQLTGDTLTLFAAPISAAGADVLSDGILNFHLDADSQLSLAIAADGFVEHDHQWELVLNGEQMQSGLYNLAAGDHSLYWYVDAIEPGNPTFTMVAAFASAVPEPAMWVGLLAIAGGLVWRWRFR